MARLRPPLAFGLALVAGLVLMFMDTRPAFDDTAITVVGLVGAAFLAVVIDGSADLRRALALALLVGIWIPIVEIALSGTFGSVMALVFAGAGAVAGLLVARTLRGPDG
ncbi:MAG: hypothetical protein HYX55_01520 [Chloroflexi bacterium]|nr:hypothetical protein [Chloroflexota bacterium]